MNKMIKIFVLVMIIIFLVMFFASGNGYYEYELNKKTMLTQESILEFEDAIKNGKEIDINNYLKEEKKDYANSFSNIGLNLSTKIGNIFSEGVKFIFNSIEKAVNE